MLIYAHGYVAPGTPLAIDDPGVPGTGVSLSTIAQVQGFAFATTSYRRNGLAVLEGVEDVQELATSFDSLAGKTAKRTFILGFSEGALVGTLALERSPRLFNGATNECGPIGNFRTQLDYIGDARVVFDYFFPGVIAGSATTIPGEVISGWTSTYAPKVAQAMAASPAKSAEFLRVTGIPTDTTGQVSPVSTAVEVLSYNIYATNDTKAQLGGNPYDNTKRTYSGSSNDEALNAGITRYTADDAALGALANYQTTGALEDPLVASHTTGDHVVPLAHEALYAAKVAAQERSRWLTGRSIQRYGHCTFTASELQGDVNTMLAKPPATLSPLFRWLADKRKRMTVLLSLAPDSPST